ncbi:MAG: hypothetical protein Q9169_004266 [Polycauliona sp. 2 TL-2023]
MSSPPTPPAPDNEPPTGHSIAYNGLDRANRALVDLLSNQIARGTLQQALINAILQPQGMVLLRRVPLVEESTHRDLQAPGTNRDEAIMVRSSPPEDPEDLTTQELLDSQLGVDGSSTDTDEEFHTPGPITDRTSSGLVGASPRGSRTSPNHHAPSSNFSSPMAGAPPAGSTSSLSLLDLSAPLPHRSSPRASARSSSSPQSPFFTGGLSPPRYDFSPLRGLSPAGRSPTGTRSSPTMGNYSPAQGNLGPTAPNQSPITRNQSRAPQEPSRSPERASRLPRGSSSSSPSLPSSLPPAPSLSLRRGFYFPPTEEHGSSPSAGPFSPGDRPSPAASSESTERLEWDDENLQPLHPNAPRPANDHDSDQENVAPAVIFPAVPIANPEARPQDLPKDLGPNAEEERVAGQDDDQNVTMGDAPESGDYQGDDEEEAEEAHGARETFRSARQPRRKRARMADGSSSISQVIKDEDEDEDQEPTPSSPYNTRGRVPRKRYAIEQGEQSFDARKRGYKL